MPASPCTLPFYLENNDIVADFEAPTQPLSAQLHNAIREADPETLRGILIVLSKLNALSRYLVEDQILTSTKDVAPQYADSSSEEGSIICIDDRKCSKYDVHDDNETGSHENENEDTGGEVENTDDSAIWLSSADDNLPLCENCGMTFIPELNADDICVWHEGKLASRLGKVSFLQTSL